MVTTHAIRAVALIVTIVLGWSSPAAAPMPSSPGEASSADRSTAGVVGFGYAPLTPCRLADTRRSQGFQRLARSTIRVPVSGRCGVSSEAAALVVSIAATTTSADGFATEWQAGTAMPVVSNLNWRTGETRSNTAIVSVGRDGIDLYTHASADVVVDVLGMFSPDAPGRFRSATPTRLVDTRMGARPAARSVVQVAAPQGVPPGAIAIVARVAVTDTAGAGFVTAYAAGTRRPLAALLTMDRAGQTRGAIGIVPLSVDGVDVHVSAGAHVVVDLVGWMTVDGAGDGPDRGAGDAADGRYVPIVPHRVLDTRRSAHPGSGATITAAAGASGSALVGNWTMVDVERAGFVELRAASSPRNGTAALNAETGDTVAGLALTALTSAGVSAYNSSRSHLVADVFGYFAGPQPLAVALPYAGVSPYGQVVPGPRSGAERRVLYVGDSFAEDTHRYLAEALPGWGFHQISYGGTAPCDWVEPAADAVGWFTPDVVVLTFAGNHFTPCTGEVRGDDLLANYEQGFADLCAAVAPAACVVVGQPTIATDVDYGMPRGSGLPSSRYEELARAGAWGFVDAGGACDAPDGSFAGEYRSDDGVHLNDLGRRRFADAIATYLLTLLA